MISRVNFFCVMQKVQKMFSFFLLSLSLSLSLFSNPAYTPSLAVMGKRTRYDKNLDNFSTTADGSRASPTITILCHIERNQINYVLLHGIKVIGSVSREKEDVSITIAGRNLT